MYWQNLDIHGIIAFGAWLVGLLLIFVSKNKIWQSVGIAVIALGIASIIAFIGILWNELERPPLRTLGETRLWYSMFLSVLGFLTYVRWSKQSRLVYAVVLSYALVMATVFLIINITHPETHDKTIMPALQSTWFVPHVVVYMIAYAFLGFSVLVAIYGLITYYFYEFKRETLHIADNLVYMGFGFLTMGLLFGAMWAKKAWGHYWTWDPKETWAFITWLGYLIYIHFRFHMPRKTLSPLLILVGAFIFLLTCWFVLNHLPIAQTSVHTYTME